MTEQAGLPVKGYAPTQSDDAINAVNRLKVLEEQYLRELDTISNSVDVLQPDIRWIAIARTHIQEGTMAAARSIFKPRRLEGDL